MKKVFTRWRRLAEIVSSAHDDVPFITVHSYIVLIKPGRHRAMHYHSEKKEWIGLKAGKIMVLGKYNDKRKT